MIKKLIASAVLGAAITTGMATAATANADGWGFAPASSGETASQHNAVRKAESYLKYMGFSREGLIDQLEYEQFSVADSTYAVDHVSVDWNAEAVEKATSYLRSMSFSYSGLIDQLEYEKFSPAQAQYGASVAYN